MTPYQAYTRLRHFFTARHWRGHGVHSPFIYKFVRETALGTPSRELPAKIKAAYPDRNITETIRMEEFPAETENAIIMLREPFRNSRQERLWKRWSETNHCAAVHLQGLLVVFSDKKLQKQFFKVRN